MSASAPGIATPAVPSPDTAVLLVNLDRQKRALLMARWDETFPSR